MQALADIFLVVAEVGQEGAQGVVDEEQFVVSELESGHTQKGPLTADAGSGTEVVDSTLFVTTS
jgi:hypothetical protein